MLKIIGSGTDAKISYFENEKYIFVNTSHKRAFSKHRYLEYLFLSHGLLLTENEINSLGPILGKTKKETVSIRMGRINCQKDLFVENLFCITPWRKHKVIERLSNLNIKYKKLTLIRDWRITLALISFLKFETILLFLDKKISLLDKVKFFPSAIPFLGIRLSTLLRPSTGMIAFLRMNSELKKFHSPEICLDGVAGKFDQENIELENVHYVDKKILQKINAI